MRRSFSLVLAFFSLPACLAAQADTVRPERRPVLVHEEAQAPYSLQILGADGRALPTYHHRGRTYVMGNRGERYTIRVTNPTSRRIEAVVSVDGLDAIDGREADFQRKRGYVIAPYGELRLDGYRISTEEVATFRFSSVPESYAGRKGRARHVGVIGVAIFAERAQEPVYIPAPRPYDHDDEGELRQDGAAPPAPAPGEATGGGGGRAGTIAPLSDAPARKSVERCCGEDHGHNRPGLGTRFGERRGSRVMFTRFERVHPTRPTALLTLRYNDRAGLVALGIPIEPSPGAAELELRESANPFPGSFATPPAGW